MSNIKYTFFSDNETMTQVFKETIEVFKKNYKYISSEKIDQIKSNEVLHELTTDLQDIGWWVETGKKKEEKIRLTVYNNDGTPKRYYEVDGLHKQSGTIMEIEACRAIINNQILRDVLKASSLDNINYLILSVRNMTKQKKKTLYDYNNVIFDIDDVWRNIKPPKLKGILVIGY